MRLSKNAVILPLIACLLSSVYGFDDVTDELFYSPFVHYRSSRYRHLGTDDVLSLAVDRENQEAYIGTSSGVFRISGDRITPISASGPRPYNVISLLLAGTVNNRELWLGTMDGVWRLRDGSWQLWSARVWDPAMQDWASGNSNLPGNTVTDLKSLPADFNPFNTSSTDITGTFGGFEGFDIVSPADTAEDSDDRCRIIAATDQGPAIFADSEWHPLPGNWSIYNNTAVIPLPGNTVMTIGNPGKPALIQPGDDSFKIFDAANLPDNSNAAVLYRDRTVYIAHQEGVSKVMVSGDSVIKLDEYAVPGPCVSVAADSGGNLYVGSEQGLFFVNVEEFRPQPIEISSVPINVVEVIPSLNRDRMMLWVATAGQGTWRGEIWGSRRLRMINELYEPARQFMYAGQTGQALDLLERIIALDASYAPAHTMAGTIHYNKKQFARAIEYLERANTLTGSVESATLLADAYFQVNRPELAVQRFRDILKADPDNVSFRIGYVRALDLTGDPRKAYREIIPLLRQDTGGVEIIRLGADLALRTDQFDLAMRLYRRAITRHPEDLRSYVDLARLLLSIKEYDEVTDVLLQALGHREIPDAVALLGETALATRRFGEAGVRIQRAMELEPANTRHMTLHIRLLSAQRYWDRAEMELDNLIRTYPHSRHLRAERAHLLLLRRQYLDALELLEQILAEDDSFEPALFYMARTLEHLLTSDRKYQEKLESVLTQLRNVAPWGPYMPQIRDMADNYQLNIPGL